MTACAGSSSYFMLGAVTYSNESKHRILKVPSALIKKHGAVSRLVAIKMADNIRKLGKTDLGLGITGIAGPSGGTPSKPVGTVFISLSTKNKTICRKFNFSGTRASIRKNAAIKALTLALEAC